MALRPGAISKANNTKRCNRENIREMARIFKGINDRVRALLKKILVGGFRLQEKEARELQLLLRTQARLMLIRVDPGSGNVERTLFDNQCHRVTQIKETIREIERRHKFKILNDD